MKYLWEIPLDDYLEVCKIAKANGVKPGESIEKYFLAYMKIKNKKPSCATELTEDELIKEYLSKGKNVLQINNKDGQYILYKNNEEKS